MRKKNRRKLFLHRETLGILNQRQVRGGATVKSPPGGLGGTADLCPDTPSIDFTQCHTCEPCGMVVFVTKN